MAQPWFGEGKGSREPVIDVPAQRAGGSPADGDSVQAWQARSRIVLTPIAAPSMSHRAGHPAR